MKRSILFLIIQFNLFFTNGQPVNMDRIDLWYELGPFDKANISEEAAKRILENCKLIHYEDLDTFLSDNAPYIYDMKLYRIEGVEFVFHYSELRNKGVLYGSEEALIQAINRTKMFLDSLEPINNIFENIGTPNDYVEKVPSLIQELITISNIERDTLDICVDSLILFDESLNLVLDNEKFERYFPHIIALVGTAIIEEKKGQWKFEKGTNDKYWQPKVIGEHGRDWSPFVQIYENFFEYGEVLTYEVVKSIFISREIFNN